MALGVILIVNLSISLGINKIASKKVLEAKEAAKPLEIAVTTLQDSSCTDCFDLTNTVSALKALNVKVLEEKVLEVSSVEGKELIQKYNLEKIPTVIVTGQIEKFEDPAFEKKQDALVFIGTLPPYFDVNKNSVVGLVRLTVIKDSSCTQCNDINPFINQFAALGVKIVSEEDLEYTQAASIITKYKITKVPTVILSSELEAYPTVSGAWSSVGNRSEDGSFVLTSINPPYRDLVRAKIVGLVKVTYLSDSLCSSCYNVSVHKTILERLGLKIVGEETYDISSDKGKELVTKYSIQNVPTVIISSEASDYPVIDQIWSQVGEVAQDKSYVFTNLDVLGLSYKNLETGEVKSGAAASA